MLKNQEFEGTSPKITAPKEGGKSDLLLPFGSKKPQKRSLLDKAISPFIDKGVVGQGIRYTLAGILALLAVDQINAQSYSQPSSERPAVSPYYGLIPSHEAFSSQVNNIEQQVSQVRDYTVVDLQVSGSRAAVITESLTDGKRNIAIGDLDGTGLTLKEKVIIPFYPWRMAISETNPDIIVVVGEVSPYSNQGRVWLTQNGGNTWRLIEHKSNELDNGVRTTPDNKYAFIYSGKDSHAEISFSRLDLATGEFINYTQNAECPTSYATDGPTSDFLGRPTTLKLVAPNTYNWYKMAAVRNGYFKNTFNPDYTVSCQQLNVDQYRGGLYRFTDQQARDELLLLNVDTFDSTGSRSLGTVYQNISDTLASYVQIDPTIYPPVEEPSPSMAALRVAVDRELNIVYLGVSQSSYTRRYAHTEIRSLTNLTGTASLVLEDGSWATGGKTLADSYKAMGIVKNNSEKYLLAALRADEVLGNGLHLRRITDGVTSQDLWRKAVLELLTAPVLAPTPTRTPIPTSVPSIPTATPTPTPEPSLRPRIYLPMAIRN